MPTVLTPDPAGTARATLTALFEGAVLAQEHGTAAIEDALMRDGFFVRKSAMRVPWEAGTVRVLFRTSARYPDGSTVAICFDMPQAVYDAIPRWAPATVQDYLQHGALTAAPGGFEAIWRYDGD